MFCGWRLTMSYGTLERLGSGNMTIDVLSSACTFNGSSIPTLPIVGELSFWFQKDLAAHHIDIASLVEARLSADLVLDVISAKERRTNRQYIGPDQRPLRPSHVVGCAIECTSRIVTDETIYTGTYRDWEEWPVGRFASEV
jgi:hypothetical protein